MRRCRSSSRASAKSLSKGGGRITSPAPRKFAISVVSPVTLLPNVLYQVTVTGITTRRARGEKKKRHYKKKGGDAHVCREWDSNESSTDSSSDEDAANIAVTKGLLFPNVGHKCLMAKDGKMKKVKSKSSTKYETSSDEDNCSDEEDNLRTLFANLNMHKRKN
jgi:hypothetical protein